MADLVYMADRYSMTVRGVTAMLRHDLIDALTTWRETSGVHHLTATHLSDKTQGSKVEVSAAEALAMHDAGNLCPTCPSPGGQLGARMGEDVMELLWLDLVHDAFANHDDFGRSAAMTLAALWSAPSGSGGAVRAAIDSMLPALTAAHHEHRAQVAVPGSLAHTQATGAREMLGDAVADDGSAWQSWSWAKVADPVWSLAVRGRAWFTTVWPLYLTQDCPAISTLGQPMAGESRLLVAVPGDAQKSTLRRHVLGAEFLVGTHGRFTAHHVTDALRLTADNGEKNTDLGRWLQALEAAGT